MRFKCTVTNISTLTKLTTALSALGRAAWLRLSETEVRFVLQQEHGTQVWATIEISQLFEDYVIASAAANTINLEVPLFALTRALRSCASASDAILRLTKRQSDKMPILSLTITTSSTSFLHASNNTLVTQEVPVRVLSAASVDGIREPRAPTASVAICLPWPISSVQAMAQRYLRLLNVDAAGGARRRRSSVDSDDDSTAGRIVLSANNRGVLRMAVHGESVSVRCEWGGCENMGGELVGMPQGMEVDDAAAWGERGEAVREVFVTAAVNGRELVKVLKVSCLAKRVVTCISEAGAVVFYCFFERNEEGMSSGTIMTYYMSSYSA